MSDPVDVNELSSLDELFRRSRELRSSEKFVEVLNFVTRFKKYSVFNNLLVYLQNPNVTYYATASHWKKVLHRKVKPDARPMVILAPMTPVVFVYDLSDTEGGHMPEFFEKAFLVNGEVPKHIIDLTVQNAETDGVSIRRVTLSFLHGGTAIRRYDEEAHASSQRPSYTIEINRNFSPTQSYATMCHELGHIYLGHLGSDPSRWWPDRHQHLTYGQAELEAESVSYIVCRRRGVEQRSAEYVAGYFKNESDIDKISMDLIFKVAGRIERMGEKPFPEGR